MAGSGPLVALVVGGSGFLGSALVRTLLGRGWQVRVFDRKPCAVPGAAYVGGDILRPDELRAACAGVDAVFQCASVIEWRPGADRVLHEVNVVGNRNVIAACVAAGVPRLIYTSSIDVVFDGRPIRAGDERLPYPARFLDTYSRTKAAAEREVIAANGRGQLLTCAIRPVGIFGPDDHVRIPAIIQAARQGQLVRVRPEGSRYDHVYVDNVAHMHALAAERLLPGSPVAGQCYFATDGEPTPFIDFFAPYLATYGLALPARTIPFRLAYGFAAASELWARLWPRAPAGQPLTRYVIATLGNDCYVSYAKAARDLGYAPLVSRAEAIERTLAWLRAAYPAGLVA
ncbi:NAD-dependent epimerase/dehydratase family protein [Chloroflexia bacterium SDU3-3]|nr:NAD-dependent epimerase/dehydratase family protein [Chloroflexia bacterium SDU3-3]